ncbi:MAG: HPr(Ser) kinase/phosphatase [Gammaproteobacteria bacterium]|nr:HPr(Ser) kinase/phosphatase [Gammaproteobacteria bacterium]MCI0590509.1 HPr(Ser) kinase/phosphatase [Gammaproteobacteria bacterium]
MTHITIKELFEIHAEKLGLRWITGQAGGTRTITSEGVKSKRPSIAGDDINTLGTTRTEVQEITSSKLLVGHLNLIHPNQVQILGVLELKYLEALRDISRQDALRQLFHHEPACIIIADGQEIPQYLRGKCYETNTPLLVSKLSGNRLMDSLQYYLSNLLAEVLTLHGVFMEVMAIGVLITGESGVGKSELALELITRGHRLIADDAPQFSHIAPDIINGTCPKALADFLEVRGLGIINVRELFGDSAIKSNKYLRLIIGLERMDEDHLADLDRLEGSYRTRRVLEVDIPEITLPVAPGRNLAVLVECAARNHLLRISGYSASEDFTGRQRELIEKGSL